MPNLRLSGLWAQIPWRRRKDEPEESISAKRRSNALFRKEWRPFNKSSSDSRPHSSDGPAWRPISRDGSTWRPFSRDGENKLPSVAEEDNTNSQTSGIASRRLSKIWESEDVSESSPMRGLSASYRRLTRPFLTNTASDVDEQTDQPMLAEPDESILKRLRRKSQTFTLVRPRTSTGITKRRSFFGSSTDVSRGDDGPPQMPPLPFEIPQQLIPQPEPQPQQNRPRHVPITIDYLQVPLPGDQAAKRSSFAAVGPGTAITSDELANGHNPSQGKPRVRPVSLSGSFSSIRRQSRNIFTSHHIIEESDSGKSDDDHEDIITALPGLNMEEHRRRPASSVYVPSRQLSDGPYAPADRRVLQRAVPKVVDIVAPRPMSMISASTTPKPRSRPTTATSILPSKDIYRRSLLSPESKEVLMNDEDGPKGDWSRTRHSWIGVENGPHSGSEQMEWDKLKQFIEAYSGHGGDSGVVSIRQVDNESDSSKSSDFARGGDGKYSNAQALAALEFGLT